MNNARKLTLLENAIELQSGKIVSQRVDGTYSKESGELGVLIDLGTWLLELNSSPDQLEELWLR